MKPPLELAVLARSLAKVRWICPGSLVKQYQLKQRNDRVERYGPYLIWTRKVDNKTVTVALSQKQARLVAQAIANRRRLEKLLAKMQKLSIKTILHSS
jgi:hypothetical protein